MSNAHPNEDLLRRAYALFAEGNMPAFLALCAPDIRFRVPGANPMSGEHTLHEFLKALGPAMQRVDNTFRKRILHLAANETDGFVLVIQSLERDGKPLSWQAVHHWQVRGGKLASFSEFTDDQKTFDQAWSA